MLKKGDEYKGFYVIDITDVKDFKSKGIYLRHKTTGLEVFHLLNDDEENLFSFCFRTPVSNNKGTPHVIEHSVLCGSEKFKLKEPFITIKSKSVLTFLNAMTYPEKTLYPGAAQIEKQYFDIMDVYADSVFFPILSETTFKQESHRFELDSENNLSIQGVVYNEMKGQFSNFYSCSYRSLMCSLFPNTTYEYSSGGDPLEICTMTYDEFLNFHRKYYSPENCLLYLYGNIQTEKQLDFIAEKYIPRLEKKYCLKDEKADYKSMLPKVYDEIKKLETFIPNANNSEQRFLAPNGIEGSIVSVSFYAGKPEMEQYLLFVLLCGNDSSPLKKRLKESKIADDCWTMMLSSVADQNVFIFNLVGVKKENEKKAKEIVLSSLKEIYEKGFTQDDIDAAIMSIDFNLREVKRNGGPYSIDILEKVMDGWNFGYHPAEKLTPISSFEKVKEKLKNNKNLLNSLMEKFFIDKNYVHTVIEPSDEFLNERNNKEIHFIKTSEKSINKELLKKELEILHEYQNKQDSPEALSSIPCMELSDLPDKLPKKEAKVEKTHGDICLFTDKINTNGIIYFKIFFPCDVLKPKDYLDLPLFSETLLELGWGGKNWAECLRDADKIVGEKFNSLALCSFVETEETIKNAQKFKDDNFFDRDWLGFEMKFLEEKLPEALGLMEEILNGLDFKDSERLNCLITEKIANAKPSLVPGGLEYCSMRACCAFSREDAVSEMLYGITQVNHILSYKIEDSKNLLKKFKLMYDNIKNAGCIINITAEEKSLNEAKQLLPEFINKAGLKKISSKRKYEKEDYLKFVYQYSKEKFDIIKTDTQIGYAFSAFKTEKPFTKKAAAVELLLSWITEHTFWEKLRTVHGCYGANAMIQNMTNLASFSTYRDPNPKESFDIFVESLKEVINNKLSQEDIECAILSYYSRYTIPNSPSVHGTIALRRVIKGINQDIIDFYVKNVLEINADDLLDAAKSVFDSCKDSVKAMLCSKETEINGNILELNF